MVVLDKLINMTITEKQMYPSIQAKVWGNIGQVEDLIDCVLDSFTKVLILILLLVMQIPYFSMHATDSYSEGVENGLFILSRCFSHDLRCIAANCDRS